MNSRNPDELITAYNDLLSQSEKKEKFASELLIANKELASQHDAIEKCATELTIANHQLAIEITEKEKRAAELILTNKELAYQNEQREKRAAELATACNQLKVTQDHLKEQLKGLKEMMFMTSHKVRQPVTNILGISKLLEQVINSPEELRKLIGFIRDSAMSLDIFTRELTSMMNDLEQNGKV